MLLASPTTQVQMTAAALLCILAAGKQQGGIVADSSGNLLHLLIFHSFIASDMRTLHHTPLPCFMPLCNSDHLQTTLSGMTYVTVVPLEELTAC